MKKINSIKLKRDDTVKIIKGKDRGKSGRILSIDHKNKRIIVEGLNIVKKAMKPKKQNDKGGITELEAYIPSANVMAICKKCGPTRVGYKLAGDEKLRICRKCGEKI